MVLAILKICELERFWSPSLNHCPAAVDYSKYDIGKGFARFPASAWFMLSSHFRQNFVFRNAFPCFSRFRNHFPGGWNIESMIFVSAFHVSGLGPIHVKLVFPLKPCLPKFSCFHVPATAFRGWMKYRKYDFRKGLPRFPASARFMLSLHFRQNVVY